MRFEEILSQPLEFNSFDEMVGPENLDFDFHFAGDTKLFRRVCLRFKPKIAAFAIGFRDGEGGWDFYEFLAEKHASRLIDLLPPEELARLTAARMGVAIG